MPLAGLESSIPATKRPLGSAVYIDITYPIFQTWFTPRHLRWSCGKALFPCHLNFRLLCARLTWQFYQFYFLRCTNFLLFWRGTGYLEPKVKQVHELQSAAELCVLQTCHSFSSWLSWSENVTCAGTLRALIWWVGGRKVAYLATAQI
jgi:hypothetical protein